MQLLPQGSELTSSACLREEDSVAGELEGVLYIQSLILFAPQAVPASAHLPVLLPPLASRHPALRRAAASTLRHLAEKSPSVMLPARLEKLLFNALDAEVDSDIAAHIQVMLCCVVLPSILGKAYSIARLAIAGSGHASSLDVPGPESQVISSCAGHLESSA